MAEKWAAGEVMRWIEGGLKLTEGTFGGRADVEVGLVAV
jgi:hypothetical protein